MATVSGDMLTNRPSLTPTQSSKLLPGTQNGMAKQKERAPVIPRVDVEPLYAAVKEHVGDKWVEYKDIVCRFMLGQLNQAEITHHLALIFKNETLAYEAHNRLVMAILVNATRDLPDAGIAPFVSATDKPTPTSGSLAKPGVPGGDASEARLKAEIMALPPRDRHRIKNIRADEGEGMDEAVLRARAVHMARTIRAPGDMGAPTSAGGYGGGKTNWEGEIAKRYKQQLFSESLEWPDTEAIMGRMVPIAYENGVTGGAREECAEYVSLALDTFVKELLGNLFARVREDGEGYVKTSKYKRRLEMEERMWLGEEGGVVRNEAGLLPVEVEARESRKPLSMADLKLALSLGDSYLLHFPLTAARIRTGWHGDGRVYEDEEDVEDVSSGPVKAPTTNGIHEPLTNGVANGDEMDIDVPDTGWVGGAMLDQGYAADPQTNHPQFEPTNSASSNTCERRGHLGFVLRLRGGASGPSEFYIAGINVANPAPFTATALPAPPTTWGNDSQRPPLVARGGGPVEQLPAHGDSEEPGQDIMAEDQAEEQSSAAKQQSVPRTNAAAISGPAGRHCPHCRLRFLYSRSRHQEFYEKRVNSNRSLPYFEDACAVKFTRGGRRQRRLEGHYQAMHPGVKARQGLEGRVRRR